MNRTNYQWLGFNPFSDKYPWEAANEKKARNKKSITRSKENQKILKERKAATKGKAANLNG